MSNNGILSPDTNDVLSGRGKAIMNHKGNMYYRDLVKKHKKDYVACQYRYKKDICKTIVDNIRSLSPPGRFLKQDSKTKLWHEISHEDAIAKTTQALNYGATEISKMLAPEPRVVTLKTYFGDDYDKSKVHPAAPMDQYPAAYEKPESPILGVENMATDEKSVTLKPLPLCSKSCSNTEDSHKDSNIDERAVKNESEKLSSEKNEPRSDTLSISSDAILGHFSSNQSLPTVETDLFSEVASNAEKSDKSGLLKHKSPFPDEISAVPTISHCSGIISNDSSFRSFHTNSFFSGSEAQESFQSYHINESIKSAMGLNEHCGVDIDASEESNPLETAKMSNYSASISEPIIETNASPIFERPLKSTQGFLQDDGGYETSLSEYFDNLTNNIIMVSESPEFIVYCISRPSSKIAVKIVKKDALQQKAIDKLDNEYRIAKGIPHPGIRKPTRKGSYQNSPSLVLEWVEGRSVKELKKFNIENFLKVSREILHILVGMHSNRVVHNNLTADHIIVNMNDKSAKIIGLSSSLHSHESLEHFEGDYHFISPEKTGLTSHQTDFRSDFYSLGVILYFMLSGKLPFESDNVSKLMRMHVFDEAPQLHTFDPSIPAPISKLVKKLMEKEPEDRYQSAKGILYDVELMFSEFETDPQLKSVTLAEHDFSEKILFSQRVHGRSTEVETLKTTFDRVCSGSREALFVTGVSGSGKSSLIMHIRKYISQKSGFFVNGKFDEARRSEPFSAMLDAFRCFCNLILREDEALISKFRQLILEAVGDDGKILTDLIDDLTLIIGNQPNIPDTMGSNAKNRLYYIVCKFLRAICTKQHPLVFCLDDLQRADLDSLSLLSELMTDQSVKYLYIVGSYRDDEVNDSHPLTKVLQQLEEKDVTTKHIKLESLSVKDVNDLISEVLHRSKMDTFYLTALVMKKTQGNPLFVIQFLRSLSDAGFLYFSKEKYQWEWNLGKFDVKKINNNVAELIRENMLKLGAETQHALKVASCLGNTFSFSTLELLLDKFDAIEQAVTEGIFTKRGEIYSFAHDQIWQAAYSLIPKEEKNITHLNIGKLLWEKCSNKSLEDCVFVIANLFSTALQIVDEPEEQKKMANFFLRAGGKSKLLTAFKSATNYFVTGIKFLGASGWKESYDVCLRLHIAAAESAYCNMNYDFMTEMTESVLKNSNTVVDKVLCYSLLIRGLNDRHRYKEGVNTALEALNELGQGISSENDSFFLQHVEETIALLEERHEWNSIGIMNNSSSLASMQILNDMMSSCYHSKQPKLLASASLRIIHLTLQNGASVYSAFGFCTFAVFLCAFRQDIKNGNHIGKLSLLLLEKFPSKEAIVNVNTALYIFVKNWCDHISLIIKPMLYTFKVALQIGDHEKAEYSANNYCFYVLLSGQPMAELECSLNFVMEAKRLNHTILRVIEQTQSIFVSESRNPSTLIRAMMQEFTRIHENDQMRSAKVWVICLYVASYFNEDDVIMRLIEVKSIFLFGMYLSVVKEFLNGLASLSIAKNSTEKSMWISTANKSIAQLRKWSSTSPDNILNKLALLEAELSALNGDENLAIQQYDNAISLSKKYNFIHEEALACEKAGIYYLEKKNKNNASRFFVQSYQAYFQWGATAKMCQLRTLYPLLKGLFNSVDSSLSRTVGIPSDISLCPSSVSTSEVSELFGNGSVANFSRTKKRMRRSLG